MLLQQELVLYTNNQKNGEAKVYYEDGKIAKTVSFANNQFHGLTKNYSRSGEQTLEVLFENGEPTQGFLYKGGRKTNLPAIELEKLKALKTLLFYETEDKSETK